MKKNIELIDQYQPDVMWFDNGVNSRVLDPLKLKVAAYYYNRALQWHKPVTIETKDSAFLAGSALDFERLNPRGPTQILKGVWDAEDTEGSTWGYTAEDPAETFRGAGSVINELTTILSMNGSLLLNLSPMGQGAINEQQRTALIEVGKWLAVNGEAVYGTHNWVVDGEGFTPLPPRGGLARQGGGGAAPAGAPPATPGASAPAATAPAVAAAPAVPTAAAGPQGPKPVVYRFTVKGENLYAIAQSWPGDTAVIATLATSPAAAAQFPDGKLPEGEITSVTMLGHTRKLKFTQDAEGLKVTGSVLIWFPQSQTSNAASNVLRIHSETVCFRAFAVASIVRNVAGATRMRSISALALPLGSAGRPGFLGLGWVGIPDLLQDGALYCGLWRYCRGYVQHGNASPWLLGVVRCVSPGVGSVRLGMAFQVEYFDHPIPNRLALKYLGHMHTLAVCGFSLVQLADHVCEFFYLGHAAASSKSPTLQKLGATPAAIAGVQRRVL